MLGESQHYVNLGDCETIEDLKEKVKAGYLKEPDLPFLIGFNWDQEKFGRFPQSSDLEELGIDKPVRDLVISALKPFRFIGNVIDLFMESLLAYCGCKSQSADISECS